MTEDQYRELVKSNEQCQHGLGEIKLQQALIIRLLNGSPDEDIIGVRPRLQRLEQKIDALPVEVQLRSAVDRIGTLETEWTALKNRYKGGMWVLGILGITNAVQLIALWRFLFGGH